MVVHNIVKINTVLFRIASTPTCKKSIPSSSLHFLVICVVVFLTYRQSFASQRLFITLLHLDVAALQLQCPREGTARPHAWKVLGCVDGKDVAQDFGENGRVASDMQVYGIDAHQDESEPILSMRAA